MANRYGDLGTQYFDDDQSPLVDGLIDIFESGSNSDRKPLFADADEKIPIPNPVQLDGAGRLPNVFFNGAARGVLRTATGQQIEERDPIGLGSSGDAFSPWNALVTYGLQDIVQRSDGRYYISVAGGNINNDPINNSGSWMEIRFFGVWIPEFVFNTGFVVIGNDNNLYISLTDDNAGNDPTIDIVNWKLLTNFGLGPNDKVTFADLTLSDTSPSLVSIDTNAALDEKRVQILNQNGLWREAIVNDANTTQKVIRSVIRTGNVIDSIEYGNSIDRPDHIVDGHIAVDGSPLSGNLGTITLTGNTAPGVFIKDTGSTSGRQVTYLVQNSDSFAAQSRDDSGAFLATNYTINIGATGAIVHNFLIDNAPSFRIDTNGISLTNGADYQIDSDGNIRASSAFIGTGAISGVTISAGVITATRSIHRVETEALAATDDLDTINGNIDGDFLILRANNSGRTVVCKDGTGNLFLAGDFSLSNTENTLMLRATTGGWVEISRSVV